MKKQIKSLCFIMMIFIAVVVWIYQYENANQKTPISLMINTEGHSETVELWENENGLFYAFLPSYAELHQINISLKGNKSVYLNDMKLVEGMDCTEIKMEVPYTLVYGTGKNKRQAEMIFIKSSDVSTVYIETRSGTMNHIHQEKGNQESGRITVYDVDGMLHYTGAIETIQGRGNNSWESYEKKPYTVNLYEDIAMLGMDPAKKWVLLANAGDPTNLRNKIVHDFAADFGMPYVPDSRWVDLYLNGEYTGLYQLSETNDVGKGRVELNENNSILVSMEILNKLEAQNIVSVTTDAMQSFRIRYPENIDSKTLVQTKNVLQSVENSILSENGIDPVTGKSWVEIIDLDSWVKKYLVEEVFANGDAGSISQFFYVDGNDLSGKVYAGPVWDYDRSMGNSVAWQLLRPQTFYANRIHVSPGYDTPWLYALCQNIQFVEQVKNVYINEMVPMLKELLQNDINIYRRQIEQAAKVNQIRWQTDDREFAEEIELLVQYMNDRIEFLDAVWIEEREYHRILVDHALGGNYANCIVFDGELLTGLTEYEDTKYADYIGWYYVDSDKPFDATKPIMQDTEIYVKWEMKSTESYYGNVQKSWWDKVYRLFPFGLFGVVFVILFCVDIKRCRLR